MYCNKCGTQLDDKAYYCPNCGQEVNKPYTQQPFNTTNTANQQTQNPNPQNNFNPMMNEIHSKLEDARIFGILAIAIGFLVSAVVGICLGAIGLSKLNDIQTPNAFIPEIEAKKEQIRKLNIIGIIAPLVVRVVLVILYVIFLVAFAGALANF